MADDVTQVLKQISDGDAGAMERLVPMVYDELRAVAEAFVRHERTDHTLQATALIHEAYLRMVDQKAAGWNDRKHFFAAAAQAMRHVLVDHARRRNADKRGGDRAKMPFDAGLLAAYESAVDGADLLALEQALGELAQINPLTVRVVELRYFGGLTIDEAADVLGVSPSTIEREWRYARAWLRGRLVEGDA